MSNAEYSPGEGRQYFERPETVFNRSLRWLADRRQHAELSPSDIERLRDNSVDTFKGIAVDHEALEKVRTETKWYMAEESCPSMVLSGEVTVDDEGNQPEVRFFADAPVLAINGISKRVANLLSAADHFTGHLYAYYTGASDFDENAAVYWQNRAATARAEAGDKRFKSRPLVNALAYKKHKQISYDVYSPRFLPFMKPMAKSMPQVEQCVLRHPEVQGWLRISTLSPLTGIITSYRRVIDVPQVGVNNSEVATEDSNSNGTLWSVDIAHAHSGRMLCMTKEGRPQTTDIEMLARIETSLLENGVSAAASIAMKGGLSEFMGY